MIIDWVFLFYKTYIDIFSIAGAIIAVSLTVNFLTLPLYNMADAQQEKERNIQKKMSSYVARIKHSFTGDERFMMLQTYYRQQHYSPIYALRSSISVLIQIPFFMAAYHYLSHNQAVMGASFLFLKDLGAPDRLLSFGYGGGANVLPILMTLINVVSGVLYTRGLPFREKVQVFGLAAVFLVLLYNSPSGLVLYWILNNLFSLAKNIVKKLPRPARFLHIFFSVLLLGMSVFFFIKKPNLNFYKKFIFLLFSIFFILCPFVLKMAVKNKKTNDLWSSLLSEKDSLILFIFSSIAIFLLVGFILPASVIASSPIEFSYLGNTSSPMSFVYTSIYVFFGFFVLWPCVIYFIIDKKYRSLISCFFFLCLILAVANVYFFNHDYGVLNVAFRIENTSALKRNLIPFSLLPVAIFSAFLFLICKFPFFRKNLKAIVVCICISELFFGVYKCVKIQSVFTTYSNNKIMAKTESSESIDKKNIQPIFHLNKHDKNVVVIFLDRAISSYFPYIVQQFPELREIYSGFVYYPNTLSFGIGTVTGAPAVMGGYEYTPDNMNSRPDILLMDKHNESIFVMPKLFMDAGYSVTVTDPVLTNYSWSGDLAPFNDFPEIHVEEIDGKYSNYYYDEHIDDILNSQGNIDDVARYEIRNFSILQILYPPLRNTFYNICAAGNIDTSRMFVNAFSALYFLPELTSFDNKSKSYIFMVNNTTHEPAYLNVPDYDIPVNTELDKNSCGYYTPFDELDLIHYHANAASIKQIGNWLDYLKENDCYDNTRIIIVSDHGRDLNLEKFRDFSDPVLPASFNPLFMVKDFNDNDELKTDGALMTNGDTLFFAIDKLEISDVNPFTNNKFVAEKENGVNVYMKYDWHIDQPSRFTATTFSSNEGYHVKDNIFDEENWTRMEDK